MQTRIVAGVAVIMLIIGVAIGSVAFPTTETSKITEVSTATSTRILVSMTYVASPVTSLSTSTLTVLNTVTQNASTATVTTTASAIMWVTVDGVCTTQYLNGVHFNTKFVVGENSTLTICGRLFYYGSQVKTFNSSNFLSLSAANLTGYVSGNANSKFDISVNPPSFSIGGNSDLNEGIVLTFYIHPHPNTSGTYMLNAFGWMIPDDRACAPDYLLVVGNGVPSYVLYGSCITVTGTYNSVHTYDGYTFSCPEDYVCGEVIGSTNET